MPKNARSDKRRSRYDKRSLATLMPKAFPERLRERLEPELDSYADEVLFDLRNRELGGGPACPTCGRRSDDPRPNPAHRTAVDIIPRIMKAVGDDSAVDRMLEAMNMRDQSQLALAAQMFHSAAGATIQDAERAACATIQKIIRSDPSSVPRLMEACFGMRDAAAPRELEGRNGTS